MHPESKMIDGILYFKNFMVQKESDTFYGVYASFQKRKNGPLITSGTTLESAAKKAKYLQIGYNLRIEDEDY